MFFLTLDTTAFSSFLLACTAWFLKDTEIVMWILIARHGGEDSNMCRDHDNISSLDV